MTAQIPWSRRATYRGCVLLAAALSFEGSVRAVTPAPLDYLERPSRLLRYDAQRAYSLEPNARDFTVDKPVSVNSAGFRDREFSRRKPAGTKRILCIGDSYTFGWGVAAEDSYPKVLERTLGEGYEVLNLGVYGYNAAQVHATLQSVGIQYEPDIIIYGFYWDDLLPTNPYLFDRAAFEERKRRAIEEDERPSIVRRALRSVRSAYVLVDRFRSIRGLLSPPTGPMARAYRCLLEGREADLDRLWWDEERWIGAMECAARQAKARLAVVVWPVEPQVYRDLPQCHFQERAVRAASAWSAPAIDLLPTFRAIERGGHDPYLPYERHPTPEAYRASATAIAAALRAHGLVK
jgi:hypothetical protein